MPLAYGVSSSCMGEHREAQKQLPVYFTQRDSTAERISTSAVTTER